MKSCLIFDLKSTLDNSFLFLFQLKKFSPIRIVSHIVEKSVVTNFKGKLKPNTKYLNKINKDRGCKNGAGIYLSFR